MVLMWEGVSCQFDRLTVASEDAKMTRAIEEGDGSLAPSSSVRSGVVHVERRKKTTHQPLLQIRWRWDLNI
jgi:hypothetical protein